MGYGYHMGPGYGAGGYAGAPLGGVLWGNAADVGARLDTLKATLEITDKQQAAWNAFADSAKKLAENRDAWFDKMHGESAAGTAPDWFAQHAAAMKQRDADTAAVSASFKQLYDVLTPTQRTAIDQRQVALGPRYGRGWR
jgi:hypothetical protein